MTVEGPITEVVLLQVKPGVHLSNAGRGSTQSAEEQTLFQLLELIEQQPGFISQHWVKSSTTTTAVLRSNHH